MFINLNSLMSRILNLKTFAEKIRETPGKLLYGELLQLEEWYNKRINIIKRENHRCQKCSLLCIDLDHLASYEPMRFPMLTAWLGKDPSNYPIKVKDGAMSRRLTEQELAVLRPQPVRLIPNVHHTYYVFNRLPWNYPDETFMLLCHLCHKEIHEEVKVYTYTSEDMDEKVETTPCGKCDGDGYFEEFSHIQGGICFSCGGSGIRQIKTIDP